MKTSGGISSFTASFFLKSKMLGEATWGMQRSHEQFHTPYSYAYFCHLCGDIWARVAVTDEDSVWRVWDIPCRQHARSYQAFTPGGIFFNKLLPGDMPTQVWAEDFIFLMRVKGY